MPLKSRKKYERSGLKEEEAKKILSSLLQYMDEEKPYLDSNLTIYDIAKDLEISRHYVTQVINQKLNKNFYTFINEYRIKEFKNRLANPENGHIKIMALAFESGFNSKSSFNTIFKQLEQITPSEYRRLHLDYKSV